MDKMDAGGNHVEVDARRIYIMPAMQHQVSGFFRRPASKARSALNHDGRSCSTVWS
jgi:hypothetical protein